METQKCYIIFKDPNVGEFQHEILGTVFPPTPMPDIIRFPQTQSQIIYVDEPYSTEIAIGFNNEQQTRARKQIEMILTDKNLKQKRSEKHHSPNPLEKLPFPGSQNDAVVFEVEVQPPNSYIQVPATFTVINQNKVFAKKPGAEKPNAAKDALKSQKDRKPGDSKLDQSMDKGSKDGLSQFSAEPQAVSNKFPVSMCFKNPAKEARMLLTLRNTQKTDIRIYKLEVTAHPKPVKATLEFRVPARNVTTQEIPIINNTDKEWIIKVSLQGDPNKNGHLFTCSPGMQKEFMVKRRTTGSFPITFTPRWLCTAQARLELFNPLTNDKFEYELKGYGEEPMAEDHIVIDCNAREQTTYGIEIKNPTDKDIT